MPDELQGYRVLGPKPFVQRFIEGFDKAPLLCPRGENLMVLELIYRPQHGTLKGVLLFEELPDEPEPAGAAAGGCCFRLVQTYQAFRLIGDFTADSTQPADDQRGFAGFFDSVAEMASLTNY